MHRARSAMQGDRVMSGRRVRVVQDDDDIRSALAMGLALDGDAPVEMHAGAAAIECLGRDREDAAVVDGMLAGRAPSAVSPRSVVRPSSGG